jgi:hypothetical protein
LLTHKIPLKDELMIAPRKEAPPSSPREHRLRRARRLVAALVGPFSSPERAAQPIPAWQSWFLVGWMLLVTGAYLSMLAGLWK